MKLKEEIKFLITPGKGPFGVISGVLSRLKNGRSSYKNDDKPTQRNPAQFSFNIIVIIR